MYVHANLRSRSNTERSELPMNICAARPFFSAPYTKAHAHYEPCIMSQEQVYTVIQKCRDTYTGSRI